MKVLRISMALVGVMTLAPSLWAQESTLQPVPAAPSPIATQARMLDASVAGTRIVSVGDHGVVLLSDDQGKTFRQAESVPVSTPLTGVSFVDDKHGWAVGHWGAVLATQDGGETWETLRLTADEDRPLFDVHFFNAQEGVAVGLWGLVLTTSDGGKTWNEQALQPPSEGGRGDLNLMGLFADSQGRLYATAERGKVLRSSDNGHSWEYLDTGYDGTFWTGAAMPDGRLLVGGQSGTLMLGTPDGKVWKKVPLDSRSSITAINVSGSKVDVIGLDGLLATSTDGAASFDVGRMPDGASLATVINQTVAKLAGRG